ncbi:MAG: cupin domain-containing protein [Acidobacteriota bacterium]|nr:cupin domain-containing protein [Acidobacteriota bacterium]
MFGLDTLLSPLSSDEFLQKYWGKKAVLIPGEEAKFEDLFGWEDVNNIVNNSGPGFSALRLIHEKKGLPHEEFQRLADWLAKGATLGINHVDTIDPIVGRFADVLARDLNTHVNINSYVSCPAKQAFDLHFDEHDVFAVQLAGTKKWRVFEPTMTHPLHAQNLNHKGKPPETEPYIAADMTPGDVLYLPRGHWHYALAITPCIHFAVGPASRSSAEFLFWLTRQLMDGEEFFRQDIPVARSEHLGGDQPKEYLEENLSELRSRMKELLESDALQEAVIRYTMTTNPTRRNHQLPLTWSVVEEFDEDTRWRVPSEQKLLIRFDEEEKWAVVHTRGQMVNVQGVTPQLLSQVFSGPGATFCCRELLTASPDIAWPKLRQSIAEMYKLGLLLFEGTDGTKIDP